VAVIELAPRSHLDPGTYNLHKRIHELAFGSHLGPNPLRPRPGGPRGLPGGSLNAKNPMYFFIFSFAHTISAQRLLSPTICEWTARSVH